MLISRLRPPMIIVAVAIFSGLPNFARAQLSESEMTQYVPAETCLAISFNLESILEKIGTDNEVLKKFREREKFSPADFTEISRSMTFITGGVEPENEYDIPVLMIQRYREALQPDVYNKNATDQGFGLNLEYKSETYKDHEVYTGTYNEDDGVAVMGPTPSHFFPADDMVASGTMSVIRSVVDGLGNDSPGQELAGNLNLDAEFHLLLEDGAVLAELPIFDGGLLSTEMGLPVDMTELLESLQRMEIILDFSDMTPLQLTIEMKSEVMAEKVEGLIRTGLQAAPALLMMGESEIESAIEREQEEVAPVADQMKRLIALGKKAIDEVQIERDGATINIQLANIEGLEKLPEDAVSFVAWQTIQMEQMMAKFQEMDLEFDVAPMVELDKAEETDEKSDDDGKESSDEDDGR